MTPALRSIPDTPERALGLIRVSKERVGMISPELQRTAIQQYAAATGREVVGWLEGLDESGSRAKSRWWVKLDEGIGWVEDGRADVILVWKFSRTARNRLKWAVAIDRVETAGGRLESATEQVDTTTSTGRFTRGMLAELNAFEAERIGEQWRETHERRRSRGLPHAGYPRLGYTYDREAGYVPDPATRGIAADLYRRYIDGQGFRPLVAWLDTLGVVQPRTGRPWTVRGIAYYLRTGFAAGLLQMHDPECGCQRPSQCARTIYRPGAHEPIITADAWEKYRRVRAGRAATPRRLLAPTTPLAGLVRCGGCGYAMRAKSSARYGKAYLYDCDAQGCPAPASVTRARCEAVVMTWLRRHAEDVDAAARASAASQVVAVTARTERDTLARQITRLDDALVNLTKELALGRIPAAAYDAARDELTGEREAAQGELDRLADVADRPRPSRQVFAGVLADWDTLPVAGRRELLAELVRVHVTRRPGDRPLVVARGVWE